MLNKLLSSSINRLQVYILVCISLLSICFSPKLFAQENCDLYFSETNEAAVIEYDPFLFASAIQKLNFSIRNESTTNCVFQLGVQLPNGEHGQTLTVEETNFLMELRPTDSNLLTTTETPGVFQVSIPANTTEQYSFDAVVLQDAVLAAQDHVFPLQLQIREQGVASFTGPSWSSDVIIRSVPRAQLNVTGASGSFGTGSSMNVIDFGRAETGARRKVFIQIRANTASQLSIASENGGKLLHKEMQDKAPAIDYAAFFDSEEIDLTTTDAFKRDYDLPRTYQGQSLPFELVLGDISGAMAGDYEDVITVEFSPL